MKTQWFPEIATLAFCDTLQLRNRILERQKTTSCVLHCELLEPTCGEFIAALAAGRNARNILQVGCGLATIALAAAARVTKTHLLSVHRDEESKMEDAVVVRDYIDYLDLSEYVKFIAMEPCDFISNCSDLDFVHLSGDPESYVELFDLLSLKPGAIVVADNMLQEGAKRYLQHVHCQPGVDTSTLPLGRGIEVTKVIYWEKFISGRTFNDGSDSKKITDGMCDKNMDTTLHMISSSDAFSPTAVSGQHEFKCYNLTEEGNSESASTSEHVREILEDKVNVPAISKKEQWHDLLVDDGLTPDSNMNVKSANKYDSELQKNHDQRAKMDNFMQPLETKHPDSNFLPCTVNNLLSDTLVAVVNMEAEKSSSVSKFDVQFKSDHSQTEVSIKGVDQDMLLMDITMAFNDASVSVRKANISTHDGFVEDLFSVVDSETRGPLHPSRWYAVKERIIQRIANRSLLNNTSCTP